MYHLKRTFAFGNTNNNSADQYTVEQLQLHTVHYFR